MSDLWFVAIIFVTSIVASFLFLEHSEESAIALSLIVLIPLSWFAQPGASGIDQKPNAENRTPWIEQVLGVWESMDLGVVVPMALGLGLAFIGFRTALNILRSVTHPLVMDEKGETEEGSGGEEWYVVAEQQRKSIESVEAATKDTELEMVLARIVFNVGHIIKLVKEDNRKYRRIRKFFTVYLPNTERAVINYHELMKKPHSEGLEEEHISVLRRVDELMDILLKKLVEHDKSDHDVTLSVLNALVEEEMPFLAE